MLGILVQMVESAWGAVPELLPVGFPRSLAESAVLTKVWATVALSSSATCWVPTRRFPLTGLTGTGELDKTIPGKKSSDQLAWD
jgi:hypothetical protein